MVPTFRDISVRRYFTPPGCVIERITKCNKKKTNITGLDTAASMGAKDEHSRTIFLFP